MSAPHVAPHRATLRHALLALFAAALFLVGCAKTVEGESKKWKANTDTVNTLMAQYPGMKPALEARLAKATKTWDEAESLADDAKIDRMASANSALMADFVTDLNNVDGLISTLRQDAVAAASAAGDESSRLAAKVASDDAKATITRVEKMLEKGASDEASAKAVMKKVLADIDTAQKAVSRVIEGDKKKTDDKAAADKADKDAAAAAKAAEEAKVADWTCEYCDSKNKHDATKCSSCGGARPSAK